MKSAVIILKSVTDANKAKKQLVRHEIRSAVEKVTAKNGDCGYGIRVYGDTDKILRILGILNLGYIEILDEGGA